MKKDKKLNDVKKYSNYSLKDLDYIKRYNSFILDKLEKDNTRLTSTRVDYIQDIFNIFNFKKKD